MEQEYTIQALLFGTFGSFIAGICLALLAKARTGSIKSKINEIDNELNYLDRISKGNVQLLRSAFSVFSYGLFLAFTALAIISAFQALDLPPKVKDAATILGGLMLLGSGMFFLMFGNSMQRLKDLNSTKEKLTEKKKKLQDKL